MIPQYLQDLPRGIEIRPGKKGPSVRLSFAYNSQTCRETLKGKKVSQSTIEFAKRKLAAIKYEIASGTFNYLEHFPDSPRAARMCGTKDMNRTVATGVKTYLARIKSTKAHGTWRTYNSKAQLHVIPKWGQMRIKDLQKTEIENWQVVELPAAGLSDKTINIIFIVLRGVFKDAVGDQVISFNPMDLVINLDKGEDEEPDPFTQAELTKVLEAKGAREQEVNLVGFNSRAGLRLSEVLALAWEDINISDWTVHIQRGWVLGEYKIPKTKDSDRVFELQADAIAWLKKQMVHTYALPPVAVKVRQRNARALKSEQLRFVFHNPGPGGAWSSDNVYRKAFAALLKKAGVRYRGPNQMRHTFASWLLTNLIPLEWIAPIMGTSIAMLKKHYAKMIPEDRPNIGRIIRQMLEDQAEKLQSLPEQAQEKNP